MLRQRVWQRAFASVATVFAGAGLEHTLATVCAHASLSSPQRLLALLGPRLAADEPRVALVLSQKIPLQKYYSRVCVYSFIIVLITVFNRCPVICIPVLYCTELHSHQRVRLPVAREQRIARAVCRERSARLHVCALQRRTQTAWRTVLHVGIAGRRVGRPHRIPNASRRTSRVHRVGHYDCSRTSDARREALTRAMYSYFFFYACIVQHNKLES